MRQTTGTRKSPGEKIVKDIKRATRKHYSSEEKIRIVLDGLRGEDSIAEHGKDHQRGRDSERTRGSGTLVGQSERMYCRDWSGGRPVVAMVAPWSDRGWLGCRAYGNASSEGCSEGHADKDGADGMLRASRVCSILAGSARCIANRYRLKKPALSSAHEKPFNRT